MNIEIISTGDEVLTGFIVDTNASYLANKLLDMGLYVKRQNTVSDNIHDIEQILEERSLKSDLIFVNGGLVPTSDDNTNLACANVLGVEQELNTMWLNRIKHWHTIRNRDMPETNIKQAMLPKGATLIDNKNGTACGFMIKVNKALCIFTPGVPSEFKQMLHDTILPYIKEHFVDNINKSFVKRLFLFGVSESALAKRLDVYKFDKSITIGYRAYYPTLELKLICNNTKDSIYKETLDIIKNEVLSYLICEDELDLELKIKDKIQDKNVYIYDNLTNGLLGFDLAKELNISLSLNTKSQDFDIFSFIKDKDNSFVINLLHIENKDKCEFKIELYLDNKKIALYHATLEATLKNKLLDTLNLIIKTFIYKNLYSKKMIEPDVCTTLKCDLT